MEALGGGDPAAGRDAVVPLDLALPAGARALVISGPNAGGKSVALKTVGIFTMLAQSGWDVPAREGTTLPRVGRLLVDLGDDQSIAESLSSFSAHLSHLGRFLAVADEDTLVLCDEIGHGTDPQEGTALAFAVLEELAARGAIVLASTHYGLLKAAVHDHPAMANAAMDYDEQDLRPLFTFRVGDPGTSHAFDIAARMGLPPDLLERARAMAGEERVQIETLLADLDRRARELAETTRRLRLSEERARTRAAELESRLAGLDAERRRVLESTRREAEDLVREGRRAIENAVREIRSSGADRTVVKTARDRLENLAPPARQDPAAPAAPAEIRVGDRIRIPHLNLTGRVLEVRGGRIVADAQGLRMTLGSESVRPLAGDEEAADDSGTTASTAGWGWRGETPDAPHEIDLRGMTGDEGWVRLDKLLDRAIPAGLETVNVIHGFGTGRLRDFLHARLKADPRVASFAEAGPGRGGGGATRVFLQS
jgi:DNA mismatch repair protein MutS2